MRDPAEQASAAELYADEVFAYDRVDYVSLHWGWPSPRNIIDAPHQARGSVAGVGGSLEDIPDGHCAVAIAFLEAGGYPDDLQDPDGLGIEPDAAPLNEGYGHGARSPGPQAAESERQAEIAVGQGVGKHSPATGLLAG